MAYSTNPKSESQRTIPACPTDSFLELEQGQLTLIAQDSYPTAYLFRIFIQDTAAV